MAVAPQIDEGKLHAFLGQMVGDLAAVFTEAGFGRFRRATETPFNGVFEARK